MILYAILLLGCIMFGLTLTAIANRTDWDVMHEFRLGLMQRCLRQEEDIGSLKSQVKDLEGRLSGPADYPEPTPEGMHSLEFAKKWRVCRVCGEGTLYGKMPVKLDFGREHAHQSCLD